MSDNSGIKVNRRRGYTLVYNDMLPEGKISARAWGIYVYLLSRPDGWECRVSHLRTVFIEGRDAIYTVLKELVDLGLMGKETYLDKGMKRTRYVINADQEESPSDGQKPRSAPDTESQDPGNPDADSQDAGSSDPEKPGQVIKDLPITDTDSKEEQVGSSLRSGPGDDSTSTGGASSTRATGSERPDVDRLCEHLADRIEHNGSKRPNIGVKWRDAARLMIDSDGRTEEKIHAAIDWCQNNEFWRANILSMPTLREKYEQLRLQALREQGSGKSTNVHQMNPDHPDVERRRAALGG